MLPAALAATACGALVLSVGKRFAYAPIRLSEQYRVNIGFKKSFPKRKMHDRKARLAMLMNLY